MGVCGVCVCLWVSICAEKGEGERRFKKIKSVGEKKKINAGPVKRYFWRRVLMPKMAKQEVLGGSQK